MDGVAATPRLPRGFSCGRAAAAVRGRSAAVLPVFQGDATASSNTVSESGPRRRVGGGPRGRGRRGALQPRRADERERPRALPAALRTKALVARVWGPARRTEQRRARRRPRLDQTTRCLEDTRGLRGADRGDAAGTWIFRGHPNARSRTEDRRSRGRVIGWRAVFAGRIAATPRGVTWIFRGHSNARGAGRRSTAADDREEEDARPPDLSAPRSARRSTAGRRWRRRISSRCSSSSRPRASATSWGPRTS